MALSSPFVCPPDSRPERWAWTSRTSAARAAAVGFNRLVHRLEAFFGDRLRGFARPWELASFVWFPALGIAYAFWYELRARVALEDFGIFRTAALAVVHGHSPYVAPTASALSHFDKFVYPPAAAILFAPLAALPEFIMSRRYGSE